MEIFTTSNFYLKFKENIENDMAAHGICFNLYYRPKPRQTGQNSCRAFVDTHLAEIYLLADRNIIHKTSGAFVTDPVNSILYSLPNNHFKRP